MTPQEFLKTKRPINSEYQLERLLQEYAKLMCQKQKEICADEAETKSFRGPYDETSYQIIDKDSILNSPFPEELQ